MQTYANSSKLKQIHKRERKAFAHEDPSHVKAICFGFPLVNYTSEGHEEKKRKAKLSEDHPHVKAQALGSLMSSMHAHVQTKTSHL